MTRDSRRVGLVIGAVAVLAAGLLLALLLQEGTEGARPPAVAYQVTRDPDPPRAALGSARQPERRGAPEVVAQERPVAGAGSGSAPSYTEVVIDGVRVRDHRTNKSEPFAVPATVESPRPRRIDPALTRAITDRIMPAVIACAADVPREARASQPRAQGKVVIAIERGEARVTAAQFSLLDVVGASVVPTQQCIDERARTVTAPAGTEADLASYDLVLSYALPQ
jgi:hypothetical protein